MNLLRKQTNTIEQSELERFKRSIFYVNIPVFLIIHYFFTPEIPFTLKKWILEKSPIVQNLVNIYPVIVEHSTYSHPRSDQIPVYSSKFSGGSGGITKEKGFHTLSDSDTLLISYSLLEENVHKENSNSMTQTNKTNIDKYKSNEEDSLNLNSNKSEDNKTQNSEEKLPTKIPANYRFRNDFALRWDNSVSFSIASVELKGYKYFRDMLRQIRENFAPPGLNLVWRDSAGLIISQTIKPQVVKVLFLLDEEGTVQDVKIVSSMGQKPVDEACIRVLLHQNFGKPPKEIFEYGNIFGINFVFPPLY